MVLSSYRADSETCDNQGMKNTNIYARHRYPSQIISHAVWLSPRTLFLIANSDAYKRLEIKTISSDAFRDYDSVKTFM
jgi:hypothetical protein